MTTKNNLLAGIVIVTAILLSACTEKIELKLNSAYARLVVDGAFSTDTIIQVVKLSKSLDFYNNQSPSAVSGATVTISDGSNVFLLKEDSAQKGTYETSTKLCGEIGKTYILSIMNVDVNGDKAVEEYNARSELKSVIPADSIQIAREKQPGAKDTGWVVKVFAKNVPGDAWFLFKVKKNQINLSDSAHKFTSIAYSDGSQAYINGSAVFVSDGTRSEEKIMDGDTITLEAFGITRDYYQFLIDFVAEYYPKSPIGSGPSANISTNIGPKDKAIGFFAAYSVQRVSTVYHAGKN
jgi:hypothetical protein